METGQKSRSRARNAARSLSAASKQLGGVSNTHSLRRTTSRSVEYTFQSPQELSQQEVMPFIAAMEATETMRLRSRLGFDHDPETGEAYEITPEGVEMASRLNAEDQEDYGDAQPIEKDTA